MATLTNAQGRSLNAVTSTGAGTAFLVDFTARTFTMQTVVTGGPASVSCTLQGFLFSLPASANMRNHIRQALVAFGSFLIDRGLAEDNPAIGLPRLPTSRGVPKALIREKAQLLERCADALPPMERVLVLLYLYAGLRASEARLLEWRSVEDDWLLVKGKGSKFRRVPLHPRAADALAAWRIDCADARWVFPSPKMRGRPVSATKIRCTIQTLGELAGVPELHPHVLRHTIATLMLDVSDLRTVQEFLGHASPETTAIYRRVWPADLRTAMDSVDLGRADR